MSKGSGGGNHGGGGSGLGSSSGAALAQQVLNKLFRNGVSSVVGANPTRSTSHQSSFFTGVTSTSAANKIATSQSYYKGTTGNTPMKVTVYHGGKVGITDGNHRIAAAKAAGATKVRLDVAYMGPRGGVKTIAKAKVVKL